ncbi:MAG: diheme cytochrome c [Pseudomonadota bacterium]
MPVLSHRPWRWLLAALPGLCLAPPASADEHAAPTPLLPAYRQECGSCHVAYPPRLLPAASWQRLLANLPQHFGSDASLDAATVKELSAWLGAHAATGKRAAPPPPQDRITRSAWFTREHDEVPPATWKLPAVKSPANCTACHAQADQGDFNEHRVRIPR